MNPYLLRAIVRTGSEVAPSILIPLLLLLLLWMGRTSLRSALLWLAGTALALGLVYLMLAYFPLIFWPQFRASYTMTIGQEMIREAVVAVAGAIQQVGNACAIAAMIVGLFGATQQRHWRWAVALTGGALALWIALAGYLWTGIFGQMFVTFRYWPLEQSTLLFFLLALVTPLLPLFYARTLPPRPLANSAHLPPPNVTAQPQPDMKTRDPA